MWIIAPEADIAPDMVWSNFYENIQRSKILFCCVRSFYTFHNKNHTVKLDPAPLFVQGAGLYVHIRYAVFVALDILEVYFMGFFRYIRLYSACFRLAGMAGLIACTKYLCGVLKLDEISQKSSDFPVGAAYE